MSEAKPFASLSSGLLARKGAAKPAMRRPNFHSDSFHSSDNGQDDLGWNDMGYDVDPDISQEEAVEKSPFNPLANAIETPKPEVKQQQERIAAQLAASHHADYESDLSYNAMAKSHSAEDEYSEYNMPSSAAKSAENEIISSEPNDAEQQDDIVTPLLAKKTNSESEEISKASAKPLAKPLAALSVKPVVKPKSNFKAPVQSKKPAAAKAAFTLRLDKERHLKLRLACAINNISAQKFVTEALDQRLKEMEQIDHLSDQINGAR